MILRMIIFTALVVLLSCGLAYGWSYQGTAGFWAALGNIGTVLGIISFVPIVYAVWEYMQYIRREEKERAKIHSESGTQPAVLIVDIGGMGIRNEVEAFLKSEAGFEDFDFESRVFVVHKDERNIDASSVDGILQEVEDKVDAIRAKAADKIHLFLKVPVPIAAMVGEVLANRTPVLMYHKQPNKGYQNWGTLHR